MLEDLKHIRLAAKYLSRMEINFDLVSAVDELAGQIKLEFDFVREARIMDTIAGHLSVRLTFASSGHNPLANRAGLASECFNTNKPDPVRCWAHLVCSSVLPET